MLSDKSMLYYTFINKNQYILFYEIELNIYKTVISETCRTKFSLHNVEQSSSLMNYFKIYFDTTLYTKIKKNKFCT